jgi:uncharacterized membrane protein YdbT with pleckstrin-like domain
MQETPITSPGVPQEMYHTLGKKTFYIFLLDRIGAPFILLVISVALFVLGTQPFVKNLQGVNAAPFVMLAAWIVLLLFIVFLAIVVFVTWLVYSNYKFCLGEDSLKIKRGVLTKEEVAIPYRQIQDVDLKRDLSFQMLGLSRIIILTAGQEDKTPDDSESEGILPALDSDLAEWFQAELLKRSNVQKVIEEKPQV